MSENATENPAGSSDNFIEDLRLMAIRMKTPHAVNLFNEAARRLENQALFHRAFASCLDGLPLPAVHGDGIDGCRDHKDIRRVVEHLLALIKSSQDPCKDGSPRISVQTEPPFMIGQEVDLSRWDETVRPLERMGICVVTKQERDACESGWMVTVESMSGGVNTLDSHWMKDTREKSDSK